MNKQKISKIGLLCIRNKKLLVVYKPKIGLYITPGGKIDPKETYKECIKREIYEELGCDARNLTYFRTFKGLNEKSNILYLKCYFGYLQGKITPKNEINNYIWIGRNYTNIPLGPILKNKIIPSLIRRGLM